MGFVWGPAIVTHMVVGVQLGPDFQAVLLGLNNAHQNWLTNVLNREAALSTSSKENGGAMFAEELATELQQHFSHLLEALTEDQEEDPTFDDEETFVVS
jgi:hypothetical protein